MNLTSVLSPRGGIHRQHARAGEPTQRVRERTKCLFGWPLSLLKTIGVNMIRDKSIITECKGDQKHILASNIIRSFFLYI